MPDGQGHVTDVVKYESQPLLKRRSCELVNTPSPCVKKALFHLERLKGLMRNAGSGEPEQIVSYHEHIENPENDRPIRKQLRFLTPAIADTPSSDNDSVLSQGEMSVQGIGALVQLDGDEIAGLLKRIQLTPKEVFSQVAELILRLENDRSSIEAALARERNRVKNLSAKIDAVTRRRMIQLPQAVQKEHDACAFDISELQWHVSYTERQLERSKENVEVAQVLNDSLKEDINFVKKHCPLVEEKLTIEKEAMKKIKTMQKNTDDELTDAQIVLDKAEATYQKAVEKAEIERKSTKEDLDTVHGQLTLLKKDLTHSKAMYQAYVKKAEQSREKLENQGTELSELEKKAEEVREAEQNEVYRIEELRDIVKQVEFETGEITKQKTILEDGLEKLHKDKRSKIYDLEVEYKGALRTLRELQEVNRDMKYDIEDMSEEIKTCDKAMMKSEREIDRYRKERERCEKQLKLANEEVTNIAMINMELKNQLEKEEIKSQSVEDALKSTSENLRKQVNDEMRQRTALEVRRQQNSKALLKGKTENVKKKAKIEKNLENSKQAVNKVATEVQKLQREHEKTVEMINGLEGQLTEVNREHEMTEKVLSAEKKEIEPVEHKLQEEQMSLKEKIKEMEFEESQMTQKLKDMKISQAAMQKRKNATETSIAKLKEEFDELQIQLSCGEKSNANLESQLEETKRRVAEREKQHKELMKEREAVKQQLEESMKAEHASNHELAQKYRQLQSEHIDLKNRLMTLYDTKVKLEISIKDHKQLLTLQEKLNHALKQYYHDRAEFNKAGLTKFHVRSHDNTDLMVNVQHGLDLALDNISLFLRSQIDGTAVDRVHQAAMNWLNA
ncbi:uncharacterized protein LOC143450548 [Clavelina lepadiformis]|uniref:uncharacterized protein LOC143450548 n=1 Tax=Clavelina lepadiformis TaxID=159417 RepID=UPI00404141F6